MVEGRTSAPVASCAAAARHKAQTSESVRREISRSSAWRAWKETGGRGGGPRAATLLQPARLGRRAGPDAQGWQGVRAFGRSGVG